MRRGGYGCLVGITETIRVTGRPKSILAAVIVAGAITLAAGCVTTQTSYQTLPPYASISDEDRDPASAPKPPDSDSDSGGFIDAIMYPFHLIAEAF